MMGTVRPYFQRKRFTRTFSQCFSTVHLLHQGELCRTAAGQGDTFVS